MSEELQLQSLKEEIIEFRKNLERQLATVDKLLEEHQARIEELNRESRINRAVLSMTLEKLKFWFSPSQAAELRTLIDELTAITEARK